MPAFDGGGHVIVGVAERGIATSSCDTCVPKALPSVAALLALQHLSRLRETVPDGRVRGGAACGAEVDSGRTEGFPNRQFKASCPLARYRCRLAVVPNSAGAAVGGTRICGGGSVPGTIPASTFY